VTPVGPHIPLKTPNGLIHDWTGAVFIPNVIFEGILPLLRSYDRYKEFYYPNVVNSRLIATSRLSDQFATVLDNRSLIAKTALDTEYRTAYTCVDDHRWYNIAETTRVQEIAGYETPSQHMLPEDQGTGLMWRLHTITRFEEREGGVYGGYCAQPRYSACSSVGHRARCPPRIQVLSYHLSSADGSGSAAAQSRRRHGLRGTPSLCGWASVRAWLIAISGDCDKVVSLTARGHRMTPN
jgi:hypothetical protein